MTEAERLRLQFEPMTDEQHNMTPAEKARINAEVAAILKQYGVA